MLTLSLTKLDILLVRDSDGSERAVRFIKYAPCTNGSDAACFVGEILTHSGAACRTRKQFLVIDVLKKFPPGIDLDKAFENWLLAK